MLMKYEQRSTSCYNKSIKKVPRGGKVKSFGELFRECRKKSGLTQAEIGRALTKDATLISKIEHNHTALPSPSDMSILRKTFQEKDVPLSLLDELQESWTLTTRTGTSSTNVDDSLIQLLLRTKEELEDGDRLAYTEDIRTRIFLWRTLREIQQGINNNEIPFRRGEKEYGVLIDRVQEPDYQLEPRARMSRATVRRYLANNEGAMKDLITALEIAEINGDLLLQAKLKIELGDYYRRSLVDEMPMVIKYYSDANDIYGELKIDNPIPKIKLASCYAISGDPKEALKYCDEGLKSARLNGDRNSERKGEEFKAWALSMLGQVGDALKTQQKAHALLKIVSVHPKEFAKSCSYLAGFYAMCGLQEEAETHYNEALNHMDEAWKKIREDREDRELFIRSWVLRGLGQLYSRNPEKRVTAQRLISESLEIAKEINDLIIMGQAHELQGRLDVFDGKYNAARKKLLSAKGFYERCGLTSIGEKERCNPYYLAGLKNSQTELEFAAGDLLKSQLFAEEAIQIAESQGFMGQLLTAQLWKALILLTATSDVENAVQLYSEIVTKAITIDIYQLRRCLRAVTMHIEQIRRKGNENLSHQLANIVRKDWSKQFRVSGTNAEMRTELDTWLKSIASPSED